MNEFDKKEKQRRCQFKLKMKQEQLANLEHRLDRAQMEIHRLEDLVISCRMTIYNYRKQLGELTELTDAEINMIKNFYAKLCEGKESGKKDPNFEVQFHVRGIGGNLYLSKLENYVRPDEELTELIKRVCGCYDIELITETFDRKGVRHSYHKDTIFTLGHLDELDNYIN